MGWCIITERENELRELCDTSQLINKIVISRCILLKDAIMVEFHDFSDVSEAIYDVEIYCKLVWESGQVFIKLVNSKSRVSFLKQLIVSKLELCTVVLVTELFKFVIFAFTTSVVKIFVWPNFMIIFSWIKIESYVPETFVINGISKNL